MTRFFRVGFLVALVAVLWIANGESAVAARPAPSPSPSSSPLPLPTATPEPPDKAIPRLEGVLKADPNNREAALELSGYYLGVGRPDRTLGLTQKLLSSGMKTANVYYLDGVANEQLGRIKEATADLEQASNLEPTNSQVLLTLTELYLRTNRTPDAERVAKRAITFNKDDKRAYLNYGLVLAQEKKYDEARAQFELAAKLDPKDPGPVILEGRSYIDQNSIPLALQVFERALTIDPKNPDALVAKARLLAAQHNVKDSIATYELLLAAVTDADAKVGVLDEEAKVYATEKMPSEAEAVLKRAIAAYPAVLHAHVAYGDYLASPGVKQYQRAEAEWLAAVGPNRDNPEALARLGDYYLQANQPQKAVDQLKRLAEINPQDAGALNALGQAYSQTRQYDRARDAFGRSFQLARTPQALAGLAASDFQLKNYREAAQVFDALDKSATDFLRANPQLYFAMGRSYAQTNQKAKAKSAYSRFLTFVRPGSQAYKEVQKLIADLDRGTPTPKATASPSKR